MDGSDTFKEETRTIEKKILTNGLSNPDKIVLLEKMYDKIVYLEDKVSFLENNIVQICNNKDITSKKHNIKTNKMTNANHTII